MSMSGQIAASGSLPIELVAAVVVVSMVLGAVDILRQPGWAWKQAEESQVAYFILDLLLPVIGLGLYAFRARPKVTALVAAGPTAGRPAEVEGETADPDVSRPEPATSPATAVTPTTVAEPTTAAPNRFTTFREVTGGEPGNGSGETAPDPDQAGAFEISSTFFSTGAATRTVRHPLALARAYRPRQRTSLSEPEPEPELRARARVRAHGRIPTPGRVRARGPIPARSRGRARSRNGARARGGRRRPNRPLRLEGGPHRPAPIPLLGRVPLDRKRGRRR